MKLSPYLFLAAGAIVVAGPHRAAADAQIDSWLKVYSGKYARIYTDASAQSAGNAVSTWSNGSQTQSLPAYSGVQEVYSSANWVYLRTTGLGSHVMGPWSTGFPNLPANQHVFYRIPRTPSVPASRTLTGLGAIGYFVDGVAMFDSRDAFYWNGTSETQGTGSWNREAYVNESSTFDPAFAHQENTGTYHYHANPIALRYLLGDHVDYNSGTKTYGESATAVTKHSPILGWVRDGYPIYGPYGYSSASNSASGIRRMTSGFQLRNGQRGSDNLTSSGRSTIPAWAVRAYAISAGQSGPAVSGSYPLGRYMEDNAYLGDLGYVQGVDFDLDEYNGRFCFTPEFPSGTYAYFVSLTAAGAPSFPYNIGRSFYGSPTGASVTSLAETVTTNFVGGGSAETRVRAPAVAGGTVTLVWSSVEGGGYRVESSTTLTNWATNTTVASQGLTTQTATNAGAGNQFFRVVRASLASFDGVTGGTTGGGGGIVSVSPTSGTRGSVVTLTINLDSAAQPSPPPQNAPINSVTVGTISGTSLTHVSQTQVRASISIPGGAATGAQTVTVVFPGPPENPTATVTYTLNGGFTVQ